MVEEDECLCLGKCNDVKENEEMTMILNIISVFKYYPKSSGVYLVLLL
jgi:hypothetical protein